LSVYFSFSHQYQRCYRGYLLGCATKPLLSVRCWYGKTGQAKTGTPNPSYSDILELFLFKTYGNNELSFDYTFPANVTPYVIRVTFNTSDQITGMVSAS